VLGMTPHEFRQYCEGDADRREDEHVMLAWLQANIMNCWVAEGKPKMRSEKLFKRRDAVPDFQSSEEMNDYMRKRVANDD
jgi:endonuclease I